MTTHTENQQSLLSLLQAGKQSVSKRRQTIFRLYRWVGEFISKIYKQIAAAEFTEVDAYIRAID